MPTPDQLASRKEVDDFMDRVAKPIRKLAAHVKSEWFGRPDEELRGWIERGRAISEIADSVGYRLIISQTDKEIAWAQEQLEVGKLDVNELRMYLKALRFFHDFIATTERNADVSSSVLAGRSATIARETLAFVKNAQVRG